MEAPLAAIGRDHGLIRVLFKNAGTPVTCSQASIVV
jgi:hypothetical protein